MNIPYYVEKGRNEVEEIHNILSNTGITEEEIVDFLYDESNTISLVTDENIDRAKHLKSVLLHRYNSNKVDYRDGIQRLLLSRSDG